LGRYPSIIPICRLIGFELALSANFGPTRYRSRFVGTGRWHPRGFPPFSTGIPGCFVRPRLLPRVNTMMVNRLAISSKKIRNPCTRPMKNPGGSKAVGSGWVAQCTYQIRRAATRQRTPRQIRVRTPKFAPPSGLNALTTAQTPKSRQIVVRPKSMYVRMLIQSLFPAIK